MLKAFFEFAGEDLKNPRTYLIFIGLGCLIAYNYTVDLEDTVLAFYQNTWKGILGFLLVFGGAFLLASVFIIPKKLLLKILKQKKFLIYFFATFLMIATYQACNLFTIWMQGKPTDYFTAKLGNRFSSLSFYLLMMLVLGVIIGKKEFKMFGLFQFNFKAKIYWYFLLAMVPLIAWAATQQDFLQHYPNLQISRIPRHEYLKKFLLFEPLYLMDFVGVEWLFRGFIILTFAKFFNRETVILAAVVYCIFHFGKPMMECISSFFGGYILGYMSYKSKTIWGGIIVHMGIALMMDIFAIISNFAR